MTRREVAVLCCRVLALVVLAWSFITSASVFPLLGEMLVGPSPYGTGARSRSTTATVHVTATCAGLLVAMALAWKADVISHWMATDDPAPVTGPELSTQALLPVACVAVGLFTIVRALPTIWRLLAGIVYFESSFSEYWADDEWKVSLTSDVIMLALGAWLTFGSREFVRLIMCARSGGSQVTRPTDDSPPLQAS
jgi:hypothetical protein